MRRLVFVLLSLVLAGCGGGDGDAGGVGPEPTPPPEATVDPARAELERRRAQIRAELRAYQRLTPKRASRTYSATDGVALELGTPQLRADTRRLDRNLDIDFGDPDYERKTARIQRQEWSTMVPTWSRHIRELARLDLGDPLSRSARDFQLQEWRRSRSILAEFLERLRTAPPAETHDAYYQARSFSQNPRWSVVIGNVSRRREAVVRQLRRDLARLRAAEEVGPGTPSVGDAYRTVIRRGFVSPLREVGQREPIVAGLQWMLFRIRQLEGTPAGAYENARLTIALQDLSVGRSPYEELLRVGGELLNSEGIYTPKLLARARRTRAWAVEVLRRRPVPPLLEDTRDRMVGLFERLDLEDPAERLDYFDLNDQLGPEQKRLTGILRKGARIVDSPRRQKRSLAVTLAATRP